VSATVTVRVHPSAHRNALRGLRADGAWKIEVTAPPADGRANRAVCELLAELLSVPASRVTVTRGASARTKQVTIQGLSASELESRLAHAAAKP